MSGARKRSREVRFEPIDVPPLLPLWLAAGLGSCILVVLLCITFFYPLADRQEFRGPTQHLPQAPRLQVAPAADLARYDASKDRELRQSPMPIDAAMRATSQQGWGPPR